MAEENYLERLTNYDKTLDKEIGDCKNSLYKFLGKNAMIKDPAIEGLVERIISVNKFKLELYKTFPELKEYIDAKKQKGEQK